MALSAQQRLDTLQAALDDLAKSMRLAVQFQPAALPGLRAQFRSIMAQAAALRQQISGSEVPSDFMQALSRFSDQAVAVGKELGGDALDATKGLATTVRFLPWVVGGAVLLLGIALVVGFGKGSLKANLSPV